MTPGCLLLAFSLVLPATASVGPRFVHCFDFGCRQRQEIRYNDAQWHAITALFSPRARDAASERQVIRRAVARMERFSGAIAGTAADRGGNYPGYDAPRQQDCIDESTNTFQYLVALDDLGLLRWHVAGPKDRRRVWFATHWTATIVERASGQRYAVDSWYRDNGELPLMQPLEQWRRMRDWPVEHNPELAAREG